MSIDVSIEFGVHNLKEISKDELDQILDDHYLWLKNHKDGKRADLRGLCLEPFDLSGKNLSQADLRGASFRKCNLKGVDFTKADLRDADLTMANLTGAKLDHADLRDADIPHAHLDEVSAKKARFVGCLLWDTSFLNAKLIHADFYLARLCDCSFYQADLTGADLFWTDIDDADFTEANLTNVHLVGAANSFWATFDRAIMKGVSIEDCSLDDDRACDTIGLYVPIHCPEEGSFIAWKKCRDDLLVKLLIPENAARTGGHRYDCRASEAKVLEIVSCEKSEKGDRAESEEIKTAPPYTFAVSLADPHFVYRLGETACPVEEFDSSLLHNGSGIHFFLSRADAERFEYENEDESDDEIDDEEEQDVTIS